MRIAQYAPETILDDVRMLSAADYEAGIEEFIDRFRREFPYPVAFYQYGEVSTPGVSDLDLLVVCRDQDWRVAHQLAREVSGLSERMRYLFAHAPAVACDSVLPHLHGLHTLHGLVPVGNGWEWEFSTTEALMGSELSFMRQAVWNSFVRVGAVFLDRTPASLRLTLLRVKNILMIAELGSAFLANPISIDIDSTAVRESILESNPADRPEVCRRAIKLVFEKANEVDRALDRDLTADDERRSIVFQPTYFCRCVAPLSASVRVRSHSLAAAGPGGWLISVPRYLVEAAAAIATFASDAVVPLRKLTRPMTRDQLQRYPGASAYADSLQQVYRLSMQHKVPFDWPMPFGVTQSPGVRRRILGLVRRTVGALAYDARDD